MTVLQAIAEVRRVGTILTQNGKLKLRFPEADRAHLEPAIEVLRQNRKAALDAVSDYADGAGKDVWLNYSEWKARELNRLFREQGVTGEPSSITAATVLHGLVTDLQTQTDSTCWSRSRSL